VKNKVADGADVNDEVGDGVSLAANRADGAVDGADGVTDGADGAVDGVDSVVEKKMV